MLRPLGVLVVSSLLIVGASCAPAPIRTLPVVDEMPTAPAGATTAVPPGDFVSFYPEAPSMLQVPPDLIAYQIECSNPASRGGYVTVARTQDGRSALIVWTRGAVSDLARAVSFEAPPTRSSTLDWGFVYDRNRDGWVDYFALLDGPRPGTTPEIRDRIRPDRAAPQRDGVRYYEADEASILLASLRLAFVHHIDDDFDGKTDAVVSSVEDPQRALWIEKQVVLRSRRFSQTVDEDWTFWMDIRVPLGRVPRTGDGRLVKIGGIAPLENHLEASSEGLESVNADIRRCRLPTGALPGRFIPASKERGAGEMVRVPAGAFSYGCNAAVDTKCGPVDEPSRTLELPAFSIDKTEVTLAQYRECVDAGACSADGLATDFYGGRPRPAWSCNWGQGGLEQHPINCVDWIQADAYCRWARKRLPSEQEWEKAARGTDGRLYPWGNKFDHGSRVANVLDETTSRRAGEIRRKQTVEYLRRRFGVVPGYDDGFLATSPVGSYPAGASPYGALDMAGNVSEWTSSTFEEEGGRVIRGGDFLSGPPSGAARVAARFHARGWEERFDSVGFRCAQ